MAIEIKKLSEDAVNLLKEMIASPSLSFGEEEQYGIAFRKGEDDAQLVADVNAAIAKLAEDGTLYNIAKKYNLENYLLVGNK